MLLCPGHVAKDGHIAGHLEALAEQPDPLEQGDG